MKISKEIVVNEKALLMSLKITKIFKGLIINGKNSMDEFKSWENFLRKKLSMVKTLLTSLHHEKISKEKISMVKTLLMSLNHKFIRK